MDSVDSGNIKCPIVPLWTLQPTLYCLFLTYFSEKLGQIIKNSSTFVTGFVLAFIKGWDMTLVMLGCIPLMGVAGAFMVRGAVS